jgi:hypothetical protein
MSGVNQTRGPVSNIAGSTGSVALLLGVTSDFSRIGQLLVKHNKLLIAFNYLIIAITVFLFKQPLGRRNLNTTQKGDSVATKWLQPGP